MQIYSSKIRSKNMILAMCMIHLLPPSSVSQRKLPPSPGHRQLCQTSLRCLEAAGVDLHISPAERQFVSVKLHVHSYTNYTNI